ncbi:hypothetical protein T4E_1811, partial [Trichinella pseudospiralis]
LNRCCSTVGIIKNFTLSTISSVATGPPTTTLYTSAKCGPISRTTPFTTTPAPTLYTWAATGTCRRSFKFFTKMSSTTTSPLVTDTSFRQAMAISATSSRPMSAATTCEKGDTLGKLKHHVNQRLPPASNGGQTSASRPNVTTVQCSRAVLKRS